MALKTPQPDSIKKRISALMVTCVLAGVVVATRAAFIQVGRDSRLETMARRQFQSKVLVRPQRGPILDRNGEPLAINVETNSLAANPGKIQNRHTLARLLSKATEIPVSKITQRLKEGKEFVWIKRHMSNEDMNRLKKWGIIDIEGDLASGLWLVKESKRVYPHGELAAHLLGSVNVDSEGLEGTELWLNEKLRGKVVSVSAIKDALGRPTFIDAIAAKDVQNGESSQLTIDASLQYSVEQELKSAVRKHNAKAGSVIVMNAVSGEILAMANEPSFNPNEKGASADRRRNRVLTDGYEPGSTFKSVLIAGALSNGMKLSDQVYAEGGKLKIQGRTISEAEAHEKFEWISLKKLIQVSSNVGAAKVALKIGPDKFYNTVRLFEFGNKSHLGFPGEISGYVPPRKTWQPLTTANIGFGQGVLVTPIQMTRAYATFLNGGWLVQPTLLKNGSETVKQEPPKRIITEKVASQVLEALEGVTSEGGTGVKAKLDGYRVAGKTGTAQAVDPNTGAYSRSRYISSFIGYAVNVEPKIVIFTSIDEPKGVYYASETAAPLFHEVLNAVSARFSMPTDEKQFAKTPARLAKAEKIEAKVREIASKEPVLQDVVSTTQAKAVDSLSWEGTRADGNHMWKMPGLKGLSSREAIRALQGHRFQLEVQGMGVIQTQYPDEGRTIADGDVIRLKLIEP